jgi:hypothetical protein
VIVAIPFPFLTWTTVPTITKFTKDFGTFAGTFRPADIHIVGPSKELPDITHADQTISAFAVSVTISILVLTGAAESAEIIVSFLNRTILTAVRINACKANIGISRKPKPAPHVVHAKEAV